MKSVLSLLAVLMLVFIGSCGSAVDHNLEAARFALDKGNWDAAIQAGTAALADEPGNVEAALLISSAYAGKGKFKLLTLASIVSDVAKRKDLFASMYDGLAPISADPAFLHSAIFALVNGLNPQPDISNIYYLDQQFQRGLLFLIESLALSPLTAKPDPNGPIDTSRITAPIKDIVQDDLKEFDQALIDSGLSPDDPIVVNGRYTYCVLRVKSGMADGFDIDILRDMNKCQLSPNDGADLSRDNGDFSSPVINKCSDFDVPDCAAPPPT